MQTVLEFLRNINIDASLAFGESLSRHTSFGIGGPADALVSPANLTGLTELHKAAKEEGIPLFFLGSGANILVGDRGIRGIVVDFRRLGGLRVEAPSTKEHRIRGGAGCTISALCEFALSQGLSGLETFYGMPGSIGGSVFMNARCYEVEMSERLEEVEYLDAEGRLGRLRIAPGEWSYKHSPFQPGGRVEGAAILSASFIVKRGAHEAICATMLAKRADREGKGHYRLPSAGSVFKNDRSLGRPTGKILDELGFRGRSVGQAQVSAWHANIFVNRGGARARDILALIDLAKDEARRALGIELETEVIVVGEL